MRIITVVIFAALTLAIRLAMADGGGAMQIWKENPYTDHEWCVLLK